MGYFHINTKDEFVYGPCRIGGPCTCEANDGPIAFVKVTQPSADYVQTLKPCSTCEGFGFVNGIKCKLCKNGFTQ